MRIVSITEQGRDGQVIYRDGLNAIAGYHEFGGGDVVAIVLMGSVSEWRARHAWAVERRAEILRFVADEVLRQRAPACSAEINETSGNILIREATTGHATTAVTASPPASQTAADTSWVRRYGVLKATVAAIGLVVALLAGAALWMYSRVLMVQPGPGTAFGNVVRTSTHLVMLIRQLQPYAPSLHHDPSIERDTLSLFLVPLDGSPASRVRLVGDLRPGGYSLAHVIGSDGRAIWVEANGLFGVDLRTSALITADDVRRANPGLDPMWIADTRGMDIVDGRLRLLNAGHTAAQAIDPVTLKAVPVPPRPVPRPLSTPPLTSYMAAGVMLSGGTWLGLQSTSDLSGGFRSGRWLRPVESAADTPRERRRLTRGELGPASDDDHHRQIRSMTPIAESEYSNASFLRANEKSEPFRVAGPDSVLMLHTSGQGAGGTVLVSRVEVGSGRLLWTGDTGLVRFKLEQILPAEGSTAFVGTRPPVPDKLSEPILVILDHTSGRLTTYSLWQ